MSKPPEVVVEVLRWVEKAESDFRNAEYVLTMKEDCPFDTVCYHCQQCMEKYLKAVLVFEEVEFPRTHDLVMLFNLSNTFNSLGILIQDLQPLNRYSIEARYPGDWEPVEEKEAKSAFEVVSSMRSVIRNFLIPLTPYGAKTQLNP
jgi:HEPN domain-containing protein